MAQAAVPYRPWPWRSWVGSFAFRPRERVRSVLVGQRGANEVIGVGVLRVELTGDLAVAHDEDAVAQREQFLGLAGHHQHAFTARCHGMDDLVDVGPGAD